MYIFIYKNINIYSYMFINLLIYSFVHLLIIYTLLLCIAKIAHSQDCAAYRHIGTGASH